MKCLKCKLEFTPQNEKLLICDKCIAERNKYIEYVDVHGHPPIIIPKKPGRKKKRGPKRKRKYVRPKKLGKRKSHYTHCWSCKREFVKIWNPIRKNFYYTRVAGRYCTTLCKDYFNKKEANKKRYVVSKKMITPITCKICNGKYLKLYAHVKIKHEMSMNDYNNLTVLT